MNENYQEVKDNNFSNSEVLADKAILINKIIADNSLTKEEKDIFLKEVEEIPENELSEVIFLIKSNYEKFIKALRLKGNIETIIQEFDNIDKSIKKLSTQSKIVVGKHEEKSRFLDSKFAEDSINSIV